MFLLRDDFFEISRLLNEGKIILFPTDTVWAIGCDAENDEAIARIASLKKAPNGSGFVSLVADIEMLHFHADVPPRIETLLAYHIRPLTVIYEKHNGISSLACASDGSAAIRVATDRFCKELLHTFGRPIIASTACLHGQKIPSYFGEISSDILQAMDYVVRFRQDEKETHEPSVIAKPDGSEEMIFIRE